MKRVVGTFVVIAAIAVAFTSAANAGGWSAASVDDHPDAIRSGEEFTISFTVLQHGMSPMNDLQPVVMFTNEVSGESIEADAFRSEVEGQYAVTTVLPESGTWHWTIDAFGEHVMAPFNVSGGEAVGGTTTSTVMAQPLAISLLVIGLMTGFAAIGLMAGPNWQHRLPVLHRRTESGKT